MHRLCSTRFERAARKLGWTRIAGLDEAGRGALFGPVVAAAVILNPKRRIVGLDDSKQVAPDRRTQLAERIRQHALAWAVAEIDAQRIDAWNIYQASRQAMTAALQQLAITPDYLLIDAMQLDVLIEQKPLIKGDCRSVSIAAASILAKTHRDARMEEWDAVYPQYGLARHKGYATADHGSLAPAWSHPLAPPLLCPRARLRLLGGQRHPDRVAPGCGPSLIGVLQNSALSGFARLSPLSFLSPTGITGCSHQTAASLTWVFLAC